MEEIRKQAAELILGDETVTTPDLTGDAAKALLDWGVAAAEQVADSAQAASEQTGEYLQDNVKNVRRVMKLVNKTAAKRGRPDDVGLVRDLLDFVESALAFVKAAPEAGAAPDETVKRASATLQIGPEAGTGDAETPQVAPQVKELVGKLVVKHSAQDDPEFMEDLLKLAERSFALGHIGLSSAVLSGRKEDEGKESERTVHHRRRKGRDND